MNATTVAVDLAKNVYQLAVADSSWKVIEQHRLTRTQFERWIAVKLLPAAYIRAYVKRNKTDAADTCALLEAARSSGITPVRIKSVEQQALQGLHRTRSLWMDTRTIAQLERELTEVAKQSPACTTLLSIPGIGLLTATAMVAATSGEVAHFKDAQDGLYLPSS
jgi:transposase